MPRIAIDHSMARRQRHDRASDSPGTDAGASHRSPRKRRAWSRRSRFAAISSTRCLLPKILDRILLMGGTFEIRECKIGVHRTDPSYARIAIQADNHETLDAILGDLVEHGASPIHPEDATIVAGRYRRRVSRRVLQHDQPADPGPDQRALGRRRSTRRWIAGSSSTAATAQPRCIPMNRVDVGMPIVVGHAGVRVLPVERPREVSLFGFMSSTVSSEKPKSISVQGVVDAIRATRAEGKKVLAGRRARRSCTPARRGTSPG